ncbi:hypothetical protein [Crocosphaera chwakensis]|uniref:Uncharacterized protein n=1 Tax=Crocosphaera chwakensis CCY0110 TaxID=391612 RepID=A3IQI7_9CHRO|nr:hypothetical protein [Crocosphaera chwakensis]EAZ91262.1 hypothetical protein CY0110_11582 [Crocosphaera chwakensis CCY0110]
MIITNLDYEEQLDQNIELLGSFREFIPTQMFSEDKFLDGKRVLLSTVSFGARANGIRSAKTELLNFSQTTEQVAEGFVSSSSSSIASISE